MLVGVGGSGKKSLTILASALAGCVLETIEPKKNYGKKEFKEDLLRMMKKAGVENKVEKLKTINKFENFYLTVINQLLIYLFFFFPSSSSV